MLGSNQISDISPLSACTKLYTLELQDNQIQDVTPLSDCHDLAYLNLDGNQIADLSCLSGCENLKSLSFRRNSVSDLKFCENMLVLESLRASDNQISTLDGYIERQELYNGSAYASYRSRSANLTIRIPADKLDSFIGQVKDASNVVSYNESQDDVTLTYVSTESRVKALETEQARLLELLSKAENMSDLLEIEARLTDVRYELENVTSQLRVLANKVDYATVYLYISQVKVYTEVEEQTIWQRISSGFMQNLADIGEAAENFFVWFVTYSPQLIVFTLLAIVVILLLHRRSQKRKAEWEKRMTPPRNLDQEQK
jgi:Leucine-rich repeat (LRR) protein